MAQHTADPNKMAELIRKIGSYVEETTLKQKGLKSYITSLQSSWNDAHYNVLLQQFQEFDKKMMNALQDAQTVIIPNLKNVKKRAEDYHKK